jgi:hypothetical protein
MNPVGKGVPPGASNVESVQYVVPRALLARASAVTATLYYQALPPYYLVDRFRPLTAKGAARARPEAQRLLNLVTRLDLEGHSSARHINDWKLAVAEHRLTGPVFGRSPPSGTATE